ncbi:MAG TPA: metallophosphoesterase [Pseudonocardiaceae bacterium]|nr:metallophosphoesterase [Pseudonocardiaceae bacterium]
MDESGRPSPAYVIGDVHGHRTELVDALRAAGLVDEDATWAGGTARVWFLGDFFDRGPDGVAVVDLVMDLGEQAAAAGGSVRALLGNHEILTLGMHQFGDTEVPSDFGSRSFERSWQLNGGQEADQTSLTDRQLDWLAGLPVLARVDDYLLMHSDTVEYLGWGQSVDEINESVGQVLAGDDIVRWWDCWRRMTTRYAFRGPDGPETADKLLAIFGGRRIVHGHSVIADQLGVPPALVDGPCLYADGRVLGVDGGVFVGGPCLVVPLAEDEVPSVEDVPEEATDEPEGEATGDTDVVAAPEASPEAAAEEPPED